MEPKENVDPENFCSEEEFVCWICVKKYKQRSLLINHLIKIHFGPEDETETTEEVRIGGKESAMEDPLGDPLADSENDPLNTSLPEGEKEESNCDIMYSNGVFIEKQPDDSPKPVTIRVQPKPLSTNEMVCKQN